MKKLFFFLLALIPLLSWSQDDLNVKGNKIFIIDTPPVWPGCEGSREELKKCFNTMLSAHISKNYRFPEGYKQEAAKQKVIVKFIINTEGLPEITAISGGTEILQKEAVRNILLLPKMKPGQAGGIPKAIKYTVPFTF